MEELFDDDTSGIFANNKIYNEMRMNLLPEIVTYFNTRSSTFCSLPYVYYINKFYKIKLLIYLVKFKS